MNQLLKQSYLLKLSAARNVHVLSFITQKQEILDTKLSLHCLFEQFVTNN